MAIDALLLDLSVNRLRRMVHRATRDGEWVESEHNRDEIGRFDVGAGTSADHGRVAIAHERDAAKHKDQASKEPRGSQAAVAHQMAAIDHTGAARLHRLMERDGGDRADAMRQTENAIKSSKAAHTGVVPARTPTPTPPARSPTPSSPAPSKPAPDSKEKGPPSRGELVGYSEADPSNRHFQSLAGKDLHAAARRLGANLPPGITTSTSFEKRGRTVLMYTEFWGADGKSVGTSKRSHNPGSGEVEHERFELEPSAQGTGLGTAYLKNSIEVYKEAGLRRINTEAALQNGAYTWARLGFVPNAADWGAVARDIEEVLPDLSPADQAQIKPLLDSSDPRTIWKIADHPQGKKLLCGSTWKGSFDLYDKASNDRLNAATARKAK